MRLIDADELYVEVLSWENCYNGFSDTYDKARIIDTIDEQPTIEAEPVRRGRWIKTDKHDIYYQPGYKCSVCKILTTCHGSYCPNCGAKMEDE